ncbi:MAG: acyl-CoA/acyl-ACP dehydrogenase [Rhodospirillaceae bacterium]|nr:acyl-CoA/acyl-ACP dehydrogenase [Rhodospirillaceae bacterium]
MTSDFPEIREAVRRVCGQFPGTYWQKLEDAGNYPTEFVAAMTEAGFLSALIPESFGGAGLPLRAAAAILEEIHAAGCNAAACHAQMYIMGSLLRHGSDAQKKRYLPEIAAGRLRLQAFGVTEPTSGSDTTSLATRAVKDGDHYVVTGQKVWTSRALQSDLMLLLARTTPAADVKRKSEGLSLFLVDMKTPGVVVKPLKAMINHNTTEVFIDQARVPAGNLIGQEGKGFSYVLDSMNAERLLIASECLGDGRWFTDKAVTYTKERKVFGRPIGQNQGVQFPIARAHAELQAAALMVREGCALFDAGQPCGPQANMGKMLASEASWHAGEACLQAHGGFGFAREYDVERKWRETRLYQVAPVSTNLILSYVAEHVLGLPRSY